MNIFKYILRRLSGAPTQEDPAANRPDISFICGPYAQINSRANNFVVIGDHARTDYDNCVVIGDNACSYGPNQMVIQTGMMHRVFYITDDQVRSIRTVVTEVLSQEPLKGQ